MSRFFIHRPIFAWVSAIAIMLGGLLALGNLAISQYPEIAPTTVRITANYSGADSRTVENSVTKIIEQGLTAIDHIDFMTSTSPSTGRASVTLFFTTEIGRESRRERVCQYVAHSVVSAYIIKKKCNQT